MFEMAWEKLGVPADDLRTKAVDLNFFQPNDYSGKNDLGLTTGSLYAGMSHNQFATAYAEMDMYVLVIQCPFGNQEKPILSAECWPQTVEIYDTGIRPDENPKQIVNVWNQSENEVPPGNGLPDPAKRYMSVNTTEAASLAFNDEYLVKD